MLMLFKIPMLKIDLKNFQSRMMFELISLVFADLPYRTYFFALANISAMYVLLFVKFSYKFIKFYVGMSCAESIQRCKDKRAKRKHQDGTYFVIGYSEP